VTDWNYDVRPWTDPAGVALRAAQRAELDARYGCDDHEPGAAPSVDDIALFIVATDANTGLAVGCGALRQLDAATAEIKRMYVVPAARGSGVATGLLRVLEASAAARGWATLRLETGTLQPDAQRFYQREGYRVIEPFGCYVGSEISVCYERQVRSRSGGAAR
jgi:GNAT superfamily N-acetyltransferase